MAEVRLGFNPELEDAYYKELDDQDIELVLISGQHLTGRLSMRSEDAIEFILTDTLKPVLVYRRAIALIGPADSTGGWFTQPLDKRDSGSPRRSEKDQQP